MTVAQLIAHLQTMPQDRQIVAIADTRLDEESEPIQLIWLEPKNNLKPAIRMLSWKVVDPVAEIVITYI